MLRLWAYALPLWVVVLVTKRLAGWGVMMGDRRVEAIQIGPGIWLCISPEVRSIDRNWQRDKAASRRVKADRLRAKADRLAPTQSPAPDGQETT